MIDKKVFAILCILLNMYGASCFMQGKTKDGIMRIVICFVTCGIVGIINAIKGIILGINVLKMTDEEYAAQFGSIDDGIPKMK